MFGVRALVRGGCVLAVAGALGMLATSASAQDTKIAFQLDWRFEGPAALFLLPAAKGYFKAERLDVTIDAGNGSGGTVTRVASGAYDMGFADLAALIEFLANNPTAPNKPVAVMMVYNNTPAAVLGAEEVRHQDAGRPAGQEDGRAGVRRRPPRVPDLREGQQARRGEVTWTSMDPPLRETMLVARRRRRDHRLLLHHAPEPRRARREGRGRGRAARTRSTASSCTATRSSSCREVPQGEPGGGEGLPARVHQGHEGRARRPRRRDRVRQGARRAHRRGAREAPPEARDRQRDRHARARRPNGFGAVQPARAERHGGRRCRDAFGTQETASNADAIWSTRSFLPSRPSGRSSRNSDRAAKGRARPCSGFFRATAGDGRWRSAFVDFRRRLARLRRAERASPSRTSTLSIGQGEFIAIVGPSGCGKSTFMKLATGLKPPSQGTVTVDGQRGHRPAQDRRHGVPGADACCPGARRSTTCCCRSRSSSPTARSFKRDRARVRDQRARAAARRSAWTATRTSSRGSSRAACSSAPSICRALIHEPKMLLLDEPFGALDAFTREELWCMLRDLQAAQRFNVILVTHDLRESGVPRRHGLRDEQAARAASSCSARSTCRARATSRSRTPTAFTRHRARAARAHRRVRKRGQAAAR